MSPFRLVVAGPTTSVPFSLEGLRWSVGRDPTSDIQLNDPLVSRRHALIYLDDEALWIRDLGARNPTIVNDDELSGERSLVPGDRLQFGSTCAELVQSDQLRAHIVHGDTGMFDDAETLVLRHVDDVNVAPSLRILSRLADSLTPVQSAADASLLTLDLVQRILPVRRGLVARIGPRESLRVIASSDRTQGADQSPVRVSRMMVTTLRREQAPICLRAPTEQRVGPNACVVAPILTRGTLTGLVYLEHGSEQPPFTQEQLDLAVCLTRILSSRLETLDVLERLQQENVHLRHGERTAPCFLGLSAAARELREQAEALANRDCATTVFGEVGSGRETIARHVHVHTQHPRPGQIRPFVILDAKPAPGTDPTGELFGSERDTLTKGKLCAAHEGALCIRNAEELPRAAQQRLTRLLQTGHVETDEGTFPLAVRLVVLTSLEPTTFLQSDLLDPAFAAALGTVTLTVPPLRERLEDIPLLAAHFLDELARETETRAARVSPRAMDRLRAYKWPGNVAELRQVLMTAGVLARGKSIYPKQLPRKLSDTWGTTSKGRPTDLPTLEEIERKHIAHVLEAVGGNKVMASSVLGIANSTLYQKMKRYGIGG